MAIFPLSLLYRCCFLCAAFVWLFSLLNFSPFNLIHYLRPLCPPIESHNAPRSHMDMWFLSARHFILSSPGMQNPGKIPVAGVPPTPQPPLCLGGSRREWQRRRITVLGVIKFDTFCPPRASICMLCADGTREGNKRLFCLLIEEKKRIACSQCKEKNIYIFGSIIFAFITYKREDILNINIIQQQHIATLTWNCNAQHILK